MFMIFYLNNKFLFSSVIIFPKTIYFRVQPYYSLVKKRTIRHQNQIGYFFFNFPFSFFLRDSFYLNFCLDFFNFFLLHSCIFFSPILENTNPLNLFKVFKTISIKKKVDLNKFLTDQFGNFLGKFLFWHYRNRIFFLHRRFFFNLKYAFAESVKFETSNCFFSTFHLSNYFLLQNSATNKKNGSHWSQNTGLFSRSFLREILPVDDLEEFEETILHRHIFDFFRNPYAFTLPPKSFLFTFQHDFRVEQSINDFTQIFAKFMIKYKHLQWPLIISNYHLIFTTVQTNLLTQVVPLERLFLNKNELTNTASIFWLMSHFLNFNICIFSLVRDRMFFSVTTARGYVLIRRSQSQFCPISTPKIYKEPSFTQIVSDKFSQLCLTLNFLGLVYFLKNGLDHHQLLTIFKLLSIKFQFKIRVRGIIIGRSLPHSLPGRFRKRRRY